MCVFYLVIRTITVVVVCNVQANGLAAQGKVTGDVASSAGDKSLFVAGHSY